MEKVDRWLGECRRDIRAFIDGLYEHDLHAKRVDSLTDATLGVMTRNRWPLQLLGRRWRRRAVW